MNKKLLIMTAFFLFSPLFNVVGVSQTPPYYDYNNPTPQAVFTHHLWMDYRQYLGRSHEGHGERRHGKLHMIILHLIRT